MQRRAEGVEARKAQFPADHRFVREGAAGTAVFFRNRRAKEPGRAGFVPDFAVVSALLIPGLEVWNVLGRNEAPRLLFEQHKVLGHPARTRKVEDVHEQSR